MTPKTHQELVEKIASIMFHSWIEGEDDDEAIAASIISEVYEALHVGIAEMERDPFIPRGAVDYCRQFLSRSPIAASKTNEASDATYAHVAAQDTAVSKAVARELKTLEATVKKPNRKFRSESLSGEEDAPAETHNSSSQSNQ